MAFHISSLLLIRNSFFNQSKFILVIFLVFSLVFSRFVSVFYGILLFLILSPLLVFVQKLSHHNEKEQRH